MGARLPRKVQSENKQVSQSFRNDSQHLHFGQFGCKLWHPLETGTRSHEGLFATKLGRVF